MSTEKKSKKPIPAADRDELAQVIADSLNKLNKDSDQIAYFLDGKEDTPTDFTDFISTGATMLDIAISNRPHGGIAVGRITELTGLEGSGKSLVGAQLIANTQKRGGVAVLIDTETAVNPDFFKAVGIDMNKLVYVHLSTVEDIFDAITNIIEKVVVNLFIDQEKPLGRSTILCSRIWTCCCCCCSCGTTNATICRTIAVVVILLLRCFSCICITCLSISDLETLEREPGQFLMRTYQGSRKI